MGFMLSSASQLAGMHFALIACWLKKAITRCFSRSAAGMVLLKA